MSTQSEIGNWQFGEDRQNAGEDSEQFDGARYSQVGNESTQRGLTQPRNTSECQHCGRRIPQHRRRVMGDNNEVVHACGECATGAELRNGAAAKPDYPLQSERDDDVGAPEYNTTREAREAQISTVQVRR